MKTEWISRIDIDKKREAEIQSYFSNETEVHVAKERGELDSLIETLKLLSREETIDNNVKNSFGENKKLDRLIIMDDISGVADVSKKFANFLIVFRKFGYNCVMFFMQLFLPVRFGKQLFLKQILLIFFQPVSHKIVLLKLFTAIAFYKVRSMFLHVRFALIGFSLI